MDRSSWIKVIKVILPAEFYFFFIFQECESEHIRPFSRVCPLDPKEIAKELAYEFLCPEHFPKFLFPFRLALYGPSGKKKLFSAGLY